MGFIDGIRKKIENARDEVLLFDFFIKDQAKLSKEKSFSVERAIEITNASITFNLNLIFIIFVLLAMLFGFNSKIWIAILLTVGILRVALNIKKIFELVHVPEGREP